MRARYVPEVTKHQTYTVDIAHDCETGVVVRERWSREGAPKFERLVIRDRLTGRVTSEKFRAGALRMTRQYGPQRKPKTPGTARPNAKAKVALG